MLRNIKDLEGYAVGATDGPIGHVKDFYIDDQAWVVRYLVVDAGAWLSSRKVLVSPIAIGQADREHKSLPAAVTKEQVKNSPDIDTDKPVSRQHEMAFSSYYGYPNYWGGAGYWAGGMVPGLILPGYGGFGSPPAIRSQEQEAYARAESARNESGDPHLRSCRAVMKYHVHASDGDLGHVAGMLVDDETWAIRYLIVDTSNWWARPPGPDRAAMDRRRQLVRFEGLGRDDAQGDPGRPRVPTRRAHGPRPRSEPP